MIGNNFFTYALIMLLAGLGIPVMAALNGGLGVKLQSPILASTILFVVSSLISVVYLAVSGNWPKSLPNNVPVYLYFGAAFVIFYILSITAIAPKFGIGNAISFVLLGQLISMALIDHYQLLGMPHNPINITRFSGLVLMTAGVFLAVRRG
ncbi:MAG: DMT family transporter [Steroidobacter sp.]